MVYTLVLQLKPLFTRQKWNFETRNKIFSIEILNKYYYCIENL